MKLIEFEYKNELENKSNHNFKQVYNRHFSNKLKRKINNFCN